MSKSTPQTLAQAAWMREYMRRIYGAQASEQPQGWYEKGGILPETGGS